jgi:hemerythrin superfamily protein
MGRDTRSIAMRHQANANDENVVHFLKGQHKEIEALFKNVVDGVGAQRKERFRELCHLLAMHEAGEETVVHPAARRTLKGGAAVVAARLLEETNAKRAIAELKVLDPDSDTFDTKIRELQISVLAHAGREEREELNKLAGSIDEERLLRMRKAVEIAEFRASDGEEESDPGVYERVTTVSPRGSAAGGS